MSALPLQTSQYFQPGTALNRVLNEAPYLPRCSDDKTATRVRPREYAVRYPYMQVNRPGAVSWLIFDLDHDNPVIWEDVGLPAPNLIVRNRTSGRSHLYYGIPRVCTTENARPRPIAFMKAVYAAFSVRLRADPDFHSGPVAKTPGHPWWITHELHSNTYDLAQLAEYVDLESPSPWSKGPKFEEVGHSRHCLLFEHVRHYAYSIVDRERERGSFDAFTRALEAYAHNKNSFVRLGFAGDLPRSSLKATVKSIARWTWDRYRGAGRHRGVMRLDKSLSLDERQRLAAKRTHTLRHQTSESKIRAACVGLLERGEALSHTAIARLTQLTRQTVAKYKHVIQDVAAGPKEVAKLAARAVKYGEHQIPAASAGFDRGAVPDRALAEDRVRDEKPPVFDG